MTGRLFPCTPTPTERATRRALARAAQTSLPIDVDPISRAELAALPCPACAGTGTGCTCDRTGATALELPTAPAVVELLHWGAIVEHHGYRYTVAQDNGGRVCSYHPLPDGRAAPAPEPGEWFTRRHYGPATYGHCDTYATPALIARITEARELAAALAPKFPELAR